jgi:serine/threonine-protein kinase RsbW
MATTQPLRIAAQVENLEAIRDFVAHRADALGASQKAIDHCILASDEAATNIIVHGYKNRGGDIEIEVSREGDYIVIRLRDKAPPYDPDKVPAPNLSLPLEERPLGGLGIYLIRHYMDDLNHRLRPDGGNELTLKKKI